MSEEKPTRKRSRRGAGSLFQKVPGGLWHIQYYAPDPDTGKIKCVKEYVKQHSKSDAQKLLNERLAGVTKGVVLAIKPATVRELYDALFTFTENNRSGKRTVEALGWRWRHLKPFFAHIPAAAVTTALIEQYKKQRKGGTEKQRPAAVATINRELATLRRMFNYGKKEASPPLVHNVPAIKLFPENNARQGFVEQQAFDRMADEAAKEGPWLRLFVKLAFTYGWRHGELINLRVRQLNFFNRTIRLDTGTTKNGEGREVYMTDGVFELLRVACDGKQQNDYVFTRDNGSPVKDFRGAWRNMCVRAGEGTYACASCAKPWQPIKEFGRQRCSCGSKNRKYKGLIPHDFRRSAAKALRRAGVPESVIMATGGWKTASMFRRYAIVSNADQRDAMKALEDARAAARQQAALTPLNPSETIIELDAADMKGASIQ